MDPSRVECAAVCARWLAATRRLGPASGRLRNAVAFGIKEEPTLDTGDPDPDEGRIAHPGLRHRGIEGLFIAFRRHVVRQMHMGIQLVVIVEGMTDRGGKLALQIKRLCLLFCTAQLRLALALGVLSPPYLLPTLLLFLVTAAATLGGIFKLGIGGVGPHVFLDHCAGNQTGTHIHFSAASAAAHAELHHNPCQGFFSAASAAAHTWSVPDFILFNLLSRLRGGSRQEPIDDAIRDLLSRLRGGSHEHRSHRCSQRLLSRLRGGSPRLLFEASVGYLLSRLRGGSQDAHGALRWLPLLSRLRGGSREISLNNSANLLLSRLRGGSLYEVHRKHMVLQAIYEK